MKQFISYIFFGITTTLVNYVVFFIFKKAGITSTDFGLTIANAIAWLTAVAYAYVTNKLWVFESKNIEPAFVVKEAFKFVLGRLFSGLFEIFLPIPLTHLFSKGISLKLAGFEMYFDAQWTAKIIVSAIVIILNYCISKLLVFRNKD